MRTFLTSDTHFNHETRERSALWLGVRRKYFSTMQEHSEALLDNINSLVGRRDRLVIAGDFAFRRAPYWRQRIRCSNIVFCIGNHDRYQDSLRAFGRVDTLRQIRWDGGALWACHYPMVQWPASHYGSYHAYGHVHDGIEEEMDRLFTNRRSMDIGVDTAKRLLGEYRPFELCEFLDLLRDRPGHHPVSRGNHG